MKHIFNLLNTRKIKPSHILSEKTDEAVVNQHKMELKEMAINVQPFRLSGLLHILTNKMADILKDYGHTVYYDVDNEVGRYIVGDNVYIEQVLEILFKDALLLNKDTEVIIKIFKEKNSFLVFDIVNEKVVMDKEIYRRYTDAYELSENQSQEINLFAKAKIIAEAMKGSLALQSSKVAGTHYIFKIPFYEDKSERGHLVALREVLANKKALFIGRDKYNTKRTQYICQTYGIRVDNMKLDDFEKKKPDLSPYDMAIIRSSDLSYKHISFFKNIYQDEKSNFKIIIIHELFEEQERIDRVKPVAHAELYSPIIIGDVEEILYQLFILESKSVKGINNLDIFDPESFTLKGDDALTLNDLAYYKGANIAIVEDSKVDEKILQSILNHDDITLFCMHNGVEMIDLLEDEEIDIIFTDINMPVMDGILMTKKIRSKKHWHKIPIVAISSMAFPSELKKMQIAGINAAITKPIESKDVYKALKKFLIMTDKIRMRKKHKSRIHFSYNKEVLDISKGIRKSNNNNLEYLENILHTMEYMRETKDSFENMIYNKEFTALRKYSNHALSMYEKMYAPAMIKMFKELNYFITQRQQAYLVDYISIYKKNWQALEEEVEKYIQNM